MKKTTTFKTFSPAILVSLSAEVVSRFPVAVGESFYSKKIQIIGIYKITSPTGKIYIGQSINIKYRFSCYRYYKCKKQPKLYNSLKKHTWQKHKFEILEECDNDEDLLNEREKHYVDLFQTFNTNNGLNVRDGGGKNAKMSNETKEKIRKIRLGTKHTPETLAKLKNVNNGRIYPKGGKASEETKAKMSLAQKGKKKNWTEQARVRFHEARGGKKFSSGHKDALKKGWLKRKANPNYKHSLLGYKHTSASKEKMSQTHKKNIKNSDNLRAMAKANGKKINQIDLITGEIIETFPSIGDAHRSTGINRCSIKNCCQNKFKRAGNFNWQYV